MSVRVVSASPGHIEERFHWDPLFGLGLATWLGFPAILGLLQFLNPLGLYACPWKALLGLPCLTCGTTRMMVALSGGHVLEAFLYQPLGFTLPLLLLSYVPFAVLAPHCLPARWSTPHVRTGGLILAAAAAANWSYLIAVGV